MAQNPTARAITSLQHQGAHEALALLTQFMPRMQPPALKHAYLSTVANTMMHAVDRKLDEKGNVLIIGFGDRSRTIPMLLVQEANDGTIRHAFTPDERNKHEKDLLDLLQEHENRWCQERDTAPRSIARLIRLRGNLNEVMLHGINVLDPPPRMLPEDLHQRWFETRYMDRQLDFGHQKKISLEDEHDLQRLEDNITHSAEMASRTLKPGAQIVTPRLDPRSRALRLDSMTDLPDPEDDHQL